MISQFLRLFSYVCHPLIMPLLGVLFYFKITPKYIPEPFLYAKLMAVTILTIVVPVLFYFMLRSLDRIGSIFVDKVSERRIPLFFQIILIGLILGVVIKGYEFPELYFFFLGILIATVLAFLLSLIQFKTSLHLMGLGGLLAFVMALSYYYEFNLLLIITLLFILIGLVASSRIQDKAHTMWEVVTGLVVGMGSQMVVFYFLL